MTASMRGRGAGKLVGAPHDPGDVHRRERTEGGIQAQKHMPFCAVGTVPLDVVQQGFPRCLAERDTDGAASLGRRERDRPGPPGNICKGEAHELKGAHAITHQEREHGVIATTLRLGTVGCRQEPERVIPLRSAGQALVFERWHGHQG